MAEFTFDDFRERAKDSQLSKWEKIGFPDQYRKENEIHIFHDIVNKLKIETSENLNILDIGCGCSDLVHHFIQFSQEKKHQLFLNDSSEMLELIQSTSDSVKKIACKFPNNEVFKPYINSFDVIIVYSVIQYPFLENSIYSFLHACINLLKPNGKLLIGDIPNLSKRNRFLNSAEGEKFKKNNTQISQNINVNHLDEERIDDAIVFSILQRFRNFNCETYLLPQYAPLPMAGRREDILIIKR